MGGTSQSKSVTGGQSVEFSSTSVTASWSEMWPLMLKHHAEVGALPQSDFAPDRSRIDAMERAGMTRTFTLRIGGELVGYAIFLVVSSIHYPGTKWAMQDAMYVVPDHRGLRAVGFIADQDEFLERDGIDVIARQVPARARVDFSRTLTRFDYVPVEKLFIRDVRSSKAKDEAVI